MQAMSIYLTFNREDFSPSDYLEKVEDEDRLEVVRLNGCWYLAAEAEKYAREHGLTEEKQIFIANDFHFLVNIYFMIKEELARIEANLPLEGRTFMSVSDYKRHLFSELKNLEWLLFFMNHQIAAAQLFEQLPKYCFYSKSAQEDWIAMCEAWGNERPEEFKIIFTVH